MYLQSEVNSGMRSAATAVLLCLNEAEVQKTTKISAPTACEMATSGGMLRHESYTFDATIKVFDAHTKLVQHIGKC